MTTPPPRSRRQRDDDTRHRLEHDVDVWVATADPAGTPYLVPLSFMWDGTHVLFATLANSATARNLRSGGRLRLGFGPTRDVVLMDAVLEEVVPATEVPAELGDEFAVRAEFDPRKEAGKYLYFRVRPERIQAWREADELPGRDLMRDGKWLAD
ncbi:pyridoxamine 5'-phosphate oxidase family protein [Actinomadura gamaensis]|uniref:Pyridoxamine 5'-phosphate oxidase family protein n=1 Tax=Actinomadura gamaensis TaxID=1763541 RepID=A0ABV9TSX7_9ACTN